MGLSSGKKCSVMIPYIWIALYRYKVNIYSQSMSENEKKNYLNSKHHAAPECQSHYWKSSLFSPVFSLLGRNSYQVALWRQLHPFLAILGDRGVEALGNKQWLTSKNFIFHVLELAFSFPCFSSDAPLLPCYLGGGRLKPSPVLSKVIIHPLEGG